MQKVIKNTLLTLLSILLAIAILWWMYRGFDWVAIREGFSSRMKWSWMLWSLPFGILAQVFRALRWRQALRPLGESPRLRTSIDAVFLSYASSLFVPRVGELLRCAVLKRWDGVDMAHSFGTVVVERMVDVVLILLLSLLTLVVQIPVFLDFFSQTGVSLESFLMSFSKTGYVVCFVCLFVLIATSVLILHRVNLLTRAKTFLKGFWEGISSVRNVQNPMLYLFYSLGIWISYYLHFYLTFYCFSSTSQLGATVALVAFVVGTFAVLVPTPNGAGPWHFAVKTVLLLYGVNAVDGALFALVVHTIQTLLVFALGVYAVVELLFFIPRKKNNPQ